VPVDVGEIGALAAGLHDGEWFHVDHIASCAWPLWSACAINGKGASAVSRASRQTSRGLIVDGLALGIRGREVLDRFVKDGGQVWQCNWHRDARLLTLDCVTVGFGDGLTCPMRVY
jgi:hypothetical protein